VSVVLDFGMAADDADQAQRDCKFGV